MVVGEAQILDVIETRHLVGKGRQFVGGHVERLELAEVPDLLWQRPQITLDDREIGEIGEIPDPRRQLRKRVVPHVERLEARQVPDLVRQRRQMIGNQRQEGHVRQPADRHGDGTRQIVVEELQFRDTGRAAGDTVPRAWIRRRVPPGVIRPVGSIRCVVEADESITLRLRRHRDHRRCPDRASLLALIPIAVEHRHQFVGYRVGDGETVVSARTVREFQRLKRGSRSTHRDRDVPGQQVVMKVQMLETGQVLELGRK